MLSLRGRLLLAGSQLRDPNFFKSVVLMVEHGTDGAMGLVVNRPTTKTVAEALAGHFEIEDRGEMVFQGGPVEPNALFIVHTAVDLDPLERPILPGLTVGGSAEVFEKVVRASGEIRYRVFLGCAGWGSGQLEGELARGDWLTAEANLDQIFGSDPYALWESLTQKTFESHRIVPHTPHPEWN